MRLSTPVMLPALLVAGMLSCTAVSIAVAQGLPWEEEGIPQVVDIQGKEAETLQEALEEVINPIEEEKAANAALLEQLATENTGRLKQKLASLGYYDASANYSITQEDGAPQVVYKLNPARPYRLARLLLEVREDNPTHSLTLPSKMNLPVKQGEILQAEIALEAKRYISEQVMAQNCISAAAVEYQLMLDRDAKTAQLTYLVSTSPKVTFGRVKYEGLEEVDEEYLRQLAAWQEGECFKLEKAEELEKSLLETGLFAAAAYTLEEQPDGTVDVAVAVTERKHRTLKAGVRLNTDEGFGLSGEWQHRNFFGQGQGVTAGADVSQLFRKIYGKYLQENFRRSDQTLEISTQFQEENLDGFDALTFDNKALISRTIEHWKLGAGVQYMLSQVEEDGADDIYGLLGTPLYADTDRRDDVLDPQEGYMLHLMTTPFVDMLNKGISFLKLRMDGSYYYTPATNFTLAVRGAYGSMLGASLGDVPANERFYSGGGGSVRGYGFQKLGPSTNGKPDGGQSFLELSTEARFKVTQTIGGVVFVDGGNAYEAATPEGELRWAAGAGVRYYTDFAPVRFDIAVPLDKTDRDEAFQVYISIGQAF